MRRINSILDRYVIREVMGPFALGVALLTFALVAGRLLKLTELVVNHGVKPVEVLGLIGYIMPGFLELTFPMAVLLGVLLGFGRMSNDQELTAARACGISLYRLAVPVMMVAIVVYAISSWFAFKVRPWANSNLAQQLYEITRTRTSAGLKEKVFNRNFPGIVLYVDQVSPADSSLSGVLISDERDPAQQNTIVARRGLLIPDRASEDRHAAPVRRIDLRPGFPEPRLQRHQLRKLRPHGPARRSSGYRPTRSRRDDACRVARRDRRRARVGAARLRG